MTSGPGDEEENMSSRRDTAHGDDASLMAALFNRRRHWTPLSPDQIKIVDAFAAGQLAAEAASAAERLVRENAFAAERVMERRLLQQAESSPTPPRALTESVLRKAEKATAHRPSMKRPFGAALLSWKIAGVAVVAVGAMVLGGNLLLNRGRSPNGIGTDATGTVASERIGTVPTIQLAMATIANRDLLLESSDVKLRSETGRSSASNPNLRKAPETSENVAARFRDIEVPSDLLASWMARARGDSQIPSAELEPIVGNSSKNIAILFDEALRTRIPQPPPPGVSKPTSTSMMLLRVYDLTRQPTDDLLKVINIKTTQRLTPGYFVTFRP